MQPDLFDWKPPCQVIPFPADRRVGHARRVAERLGEAITNKQADRILTRACRLLRDEMRGIGIPDKKIDEHRDEFLRRICAECDRINAKWIPASPESAQR